MDIPKEEPAILKQILAIHFDEFKYTIDDLDKILNFIKLMNGLWPNRWNSKFLKEPHKK